jgi:hypothetical protein
MKRSILVQVLVVLAVLATIVINVLANALPLNGQNTGEISDRFQVYFVPAGYVFSIWGVIYLGLILYAIYQALPAQRTNPRLASTDILFILSCLANIIWLFLWHYNQFPLTLVAMISLLLLLTAIYLRLGIGEVEVPASEKWLVHLPFSIYLGWVTVATIANVTSVLDFLNWSGWGISEELWAMIMLAAATIIAALVAFTRGDAAFLLVLIWAFVGIAVKQAATPSVAMAAWIASSVTVVLLVVCVYLHRGRDLKPLPAG